MPKGRAEMPENIAGILLAAGSSRRFGANKLLEPLPDGTPVAAASLRNLRAAVTPVIAVLRPGDEAIRRLLGDDAQVTVCERADEGMGVSLAHGVRAASDAAGWIVALADMPFIRPETIRLLAERLAAGAGLVAPTWRGERGHPVGIAARFRAALYGLTGDAGARELLWSRSDELDLIDCSDPGVLRDIDTPADLPY
jgi:molybdenum cofactor cytidylyltransferase